MSDQNAVDGIYQKLKSEYVAKKATEASLEFDSIVMPFLGIIVNQDKQMQEILSKVPKKKRVKVIKKKNA